MSIFKKKELVEKIEEAKSSERNFTTFFVATIDQQYMLDWSEVAEDKTLYFRINSMGGSLPASTSIMQRMVKEKRHCITENCGNAQSGGLVIFSGGKERLSPADAVFLFHCGELTGARTIDLKKLNEISEISYQIMCRRMEQISNKSFKYWMDIIKSGRNEFFHGKEMKQMGVVTKLI